MTQRHREVDPPYAARRLQLMVAGVVLIACGWQVLSLLRSVGHPVKMVANGSRSLIQIEVNSAGPQELALLPGVGPVLARRIVEYRERVGRFESLNDLSRVPGIGSKTIQEIKRIGIVELPPLRQKFSKSSDREQVQVVD